MNAATHGLALMLSAAMPAGALACTLCIGWPEKTTADYLAESHCVVLARQDKENPFAYAPHKVLKGSFDGADIDLLVDSVTRRVFQSDTSRTVLLMQLAPGGDWRQFGAVSPEFELVVRRILAFSDYWNVKDGGSDRIRFFLPLFGHRERNIRELAYLELGRAPYAVIKQLGRVASRQDFAPMLEQRQYLEWRSLAILLLAQSENPKDRQTIVDSFHAAQQFGLTTNLAAWTAAAVEIEGEAALRFIEENYFRRDDRTPEELNAVLSALSMLGVDADVQQQNRIVDCYRVLLAHSPEFAPLVAEDLQAWRRSDLTSELATILAVGTDFDLSEKQSIRSYLRASATSEDVARVEH